MNSSKEKIVVPVPNVKFTIQVSDKPVSRSTQNLMHRFRLERNCWGVRSVNVTSDNRYLVITNANNARIRVVDLDKMEFLPHKFDGHKASVRLTSSANDNSFYTASWDGTFRKYDIYTGECKVVLGGLSRSPSCCYDSINELLFTASYDSDYDLELKNTGRCWDINQRKVIAEYRHTKMRKSPECIDILYDQEFVYTGSDDGLAYKWSRNGEKPLFHFFEFEGSVRKIAVSSKYFAAACSDGLIRIHYKKSGEFYSYLIHSEKAEVLDVRISCDESRIYSASNDGSVKCFNLLTSNLIFHKNVHYSWIWSMCLMNDDQTIVTGSLDGTIAFLNNSGEILAYLFNMPGRNEFLLAAPPDKVFPNGIFYTSSKDFIEVVLIDENRKILKILGINDSTRQAYIDKFNLKNLLKTRLKKNGHYKKITEQYLKKQELKSTFNDLNLPLALGAASKKSDN
jgi:WD40 repeat protein